MTLNWETWLDEKIEEKQEKGSHFEPDPFTFHPSQLGYCKRQAYLSKLGMKVHDSDTLRIFEVGNIFHEYIQEYFQDNDRFGIEKPLTVVIPSHNDITLTGHCDLIDTKLNIIYDFKTRASWYKFEGGSLRHMTQLGLYQYMLWRDLVAKGELDEKQEVHGQIVYLCKKNLETKQYPKNTLEQFNPRNDTQHIKLVKSALEKANQIGLKIQENGIAKSEEEIPYPKCNCWICKQEDKLTFEHL